MKKRVNISLLLSVVIFSSCVSAKLSKSWSSDNFNASESKKTLVIARSNDMEVRKAYEDKLTSELNNKGINAVSSYKVFPDLKEKLKRSEGEINTIVKNFKSAGIQTIMLMALKDTKTIESVPSKMEYAKSSTVNIGRYGVSFTDYLNIHSVEYINSTLRPLINDSNNSNNEVVLSSTSYLLEAVVYDLLLESKKQLVGAYEVEVIDPKSGNQVLNRFSSLVVKQLKR